MFRGLRIRPARAHFQGQRAHATDPAGIPMPRTRPLQGFAPLLHAAVGACFCAGIGACAGARVPEPTAASLAYGVPAPPVLEYGIGDTARVELRAAGRSFPLSLAAASRWRMEFAPEGARLRVTAHLTELAARITAPMAPPRTADASSVTGPVVFTMDARGHSSIVSLPTASAPAAAQFVGGAGIAHAFFPALPGRPVTPGDAWTDTLEYSDGGAAGTRVRAVVGYAVAGDTMVEGTRHLLVRTRGTTEQTTSGEISDVEFSQSVSGTTEGWFLWNPAAGTLGELESRSELSGTMTLGIVPTPMEVEVRGLVRVRRLPSEGSPSP